jgi:hypothetical protein
VHPGPLEPGADGGLATGLHDARRGAQTLGTELGVTHTLAVSGDVPQALARLIVGASMHLQSSKDGFDLALFQLVAPLFAPLLAEFAAGTVDRLGRGAEVTLGWKRSTI